MFDKLVLSTRDRRTGRTGKFLFVTSLFYALALASALVVSVVAASPMLYEKVDVTRIVAVPPPPPPPHGSPNPPPGRPQIDTARPPTIYDPVKPLDQMNAAAAINPIPTVPTGPPKLGDIGVVGSGGPVGDPNGVRDGIGPIGNTGVPVGNFAEGAPPPPVQKPVEKPQPPVEKQIVKLASSVLSGKAIERKTPAYPPLARQARIEDAITVEIFISADGRVETARALGGHPLLTGAAVEAARGWRFQPTLLNGIPVRVTGLITFNFKLN